MKLNKLVLVIIGVLALGVTGFAAEAGDWARFSDNGEKIVVQADGIKRFEGVSTVVFNDGTKTHRIGTRRWALIGPVRHKSATTPFGPADIYEATYGKKDFPYEYTLKLKRLKDLRAFTVQGVFHNRSDKDATLHAFDLLETRKERGGSLQVENAADWLVTPLMESTDAVSLAEANKAYKEVVIIYHKNGSGFLMGPVGPAEAYTTSYVKEQAVMAGVNMDRILVRAGESRRSEEMIFLFEPINTAIDVWTRWVAITHGVRLHRGPVYGWCSWYDRTTKIDEKHAMEVIKTIEDNPNTFGKGIVQIDDGYQKMDGDWSANEKFPSGMSGIAKRVREAGHIPGVWFAPLMIHPDHPWGKKNPAAIQSNAKGIANFMNPNSFHPAGANWINPSHPESKKFLYNIISDARKRGYGYIKIDFNGIGSKFVDPTKTRMQIFRELYTLYREAAGENIYILSCLGSPTRGVVGFIDSARVGPDSHPAHFAMCLKSVLRFQIFDNVWWQNDADVSYLTDKLKSRRVGYTPEGEGMWRTWHNSVGLVGGTAMISEPINMPDAKELLRNYEIMRPGSREPAKLLTLGKSAKNTVFGFAAQRTYGDFAVYNLYNSTETVKHADKPKSAEKAKPITLDFKEAGLPLGTKCAVFDFWSNKVLGYAVDSYTTAPIEPNASALLRFTPLASARPCLVGSDLHLSIGATEIDNLRVSSTKIKIDLSNAGAQEGSLTFYSKKPLEAAGSENCKVTSVEKIGDDLWKVNTTGRQWGKTQTIELNIGK